MREVEISPGVIKDVYDYHQRSQRSKESEDRFASLYKLAFAVPKPGQVFDNAKHVGSFSGVATHNFLKPPGPSPLKNIVNPRKNLMSAMGATK